MGLSADEERADLAGKLIRFLDGRLGENGLRIEVFPRSGEGFSQQNWPFDVFSEGAPDGRPFILRRDGQSAATESSRKKEFELLRVLHGQGLPVPKPYWLDATGEHFGRPAFIMERCPGRADLNILLDNNALHLDTDTRLKLARTLADLMVQLHTLDWKALDLQDVLGLPELPPAQARLQSVVEEIERWRSEPLPEIAEAVVWLEEHMPPSRPPVLTHGEFRSIQALIDDDGNMVAMLDWEFARLSDPLDELAYFHNPTASYFHTIEGVWGEAEFLDYYQKKSGITVNPEELHWWKVLNMLWIVGYVLQSSDALATGRSDAVHSGSFNARWVAMLQALLDSTEGYHATQPY